MAAKPEVRLRRMAVRHAIALGAPLVLLALAVSSPRDAAFWVVLAAMFAVMLPLIGVLAWFYSDIRRLLRKGPETP